MRITSSLSFNPVWLGSYVKADTLIANNQLKETNNMFFLTEDTSDQIPEGLR